MLVLFVYGSELTCVNAAPLGVTLLDCPDSALLPALLVA
jgi:hypothetical protein